MKIQRNRWFREADTGGASGGAAEAGSGTEASTSTAEVFGGEEGATEGEGQQQQATQKTAEAKPLSVDDIRSVIREENKGQQKTEEKKYTPEELDQIFKVWKPDAGLITKLLAGGDDALGAMVAMREGMLTEFDTLTQHRLASLKQELVGMMNPALQVAQETRESKEQTEFFGKHTDLEPHKEMVMTVFNALKAEGFRAKSKDEAFKAIADRTRKLLGLNGSGDGQSSATHTTNNGATKPATLLSGSGARGQGTGKASGKGNVFADIFSP